MEVVHINNSTIMSAQQGMTPEDKNVVSVFNTRRVFKYCSILSNYGLVGKLATTVAFATMSITASVMTNVENCYRSCNNK